MDRSLFSVDAKNWVTIQIVICICIQVSTLVCITNFHSEDWINVSPPRFRFPWIRLMVRAITIRSVDLSWQPNISEACQYRADLLWMHERAIRMNRGIEEGVTRPISALHVTSKWCLSRVRRKAHFHGGLCHRKLIEARKGRKMMTWGERERDAKRRTIRFPVCGRS